MYSCFLQCLLRCAGETWSVIHAKKRGTFSPSLVLLRSSTTFTLQLQRTSPRRKRESRRLVLECNLKVSKFQKYQISYFAFSYSMMCITELCGFIHRHSILLLLISFYHFSTCKYTTFQIMKYPMAEKNTGFTYMLNIFEKILSLRPKKHYYERSKTENTGAKRQC